MRLARRAMAAQQWQVGRQFAAAAAPSTRGFAMQAAAPRVFASFGVYKPDHFEVTPIAPTYRALPAGGYALKNQGRILVSIAPHDGKTIEWNRKSKFGLSGVEAAQLIDVHSSVSRLASLVAAASASVCRSPCCPLRPVCRTSIPPFSRVALLALFARLRARRTVARSPRGLW